LKQGPAYREKSISTPNPIDQEAAMKAQNPIQSLIEVERPDPMRGLEEIKRLVHLNDNMVRRVTGYRHLSPRVPSEPQRHSNGD
jgi:hypothetical protein